MRDQGRRFRGGTRARTWHVLTSASCFWALPPPSSADPQQPFVGCLQPGAPPSSGVGASVGSGLGHQGLCFPSCKPERRRLQCSQRPTEGLVSQGARGSGGPRSPCVGTAVSLPATPLPFAGPTGRSQATCSLREALRGFPRPRPTPHRRAWPQRLRGLLGPRAHPTTSWSKCPQGA